jgi:phosphoadenosine phosphosulfate reductase
MELQKLKDQLAGKSIEDQILKLAALFPGKIVFTTSFGIEDQVLTHIIFENNLPVEVVTLDTGRLFPETFKVFSETKNKYNKKIRVYLPELSTLEKMVSEKGPYSFYYSKENRLECCRLRKIIPLNRALKGQKCWISGIRSGQSDNRSKMDWIEYDKERDLFKFYPLFDWSFEKIKDFIKVNYVPYNVLHDKGYVSIGCEPCTRAVTKGADFRSGRWWWENDGNKECGLHIK